ncbi:MAG: class A beta-lactamase-related serine hydrolase, partial [Sphingobacteriales bacterium]
MKKNLRLLLLLGIGVTLFSSCSKDNDPEPEPPETQNDIAALDTKVANWMTTSGMPGMSIAISKNGKLVYRKAYGKSDQEANTVATNDTRFRMASVSKLLTSVAVLKLVQNGSVAMNQKVFGTGALLGTTYGTQPYSANVQAVTVSDLLHHTSGGWGNASNDPAFYDKNWNSTQVFDQAINTLPIATPGSVFNYSNFNYMVLARIIEKVSGKTYEQFVKDEVLTPAGATQTAIAGGTLADRKTNEAKYYGQGTDATWPYDKMNMG